MRTADRVAFDAAMEATRARIQEQAAVNRRLVELIRDGGFTVWRGADLGPQLHLGFEPTPAAFPAVTMHTPGIGYRPTNQAWGGWWTATLTEDGSSAYVDFNLECSPDVARGFLNHFAWWSLTPQPSVFVLVLDGPDSFKAALSHFRYKQSVELDFEQIRDAGFAGVHVTDQAARQYGPLTEWTHESTHWLRWAFTDEVTKVEPPAWIHQMAQAVEPPWFSDDDDRFHLGGAYRGSWIRMSPLSGEILDVGERLLRARDEGLRSYEDQVIVMIALAKLAVDNHIIEHNMTGHDGQQLPVGPGLFDALGAHLAIELINLWGQAEMLRKGHDHPSRRLWQPSKRETRSVITVAGIFRAALGRR